MAKIERNKLPGHSTNITRKLKKGLMSNAEAQYMRKVIQDTRKVLNDYIDYHKTKLKTINGSGLKRKTKKGGNIVSFSDPTEMLKKIRTYYRINGYWQQ